MSPYERYIAEDFVARQIDLLRLTSYTQMRALALLDAMGRELESILRRDDLTAIGRARMNTLLRQAAEVIDRYYERVLREVDGTLTGVASFEARATAARLAEPVAGFTISISPTLPPESYIRKLMTNVLIQGAKSADWWKRQGGDTRFRFANAVRQGLIAGETNEDIVRRVSGSATSPGVLKTSKNNARTLVHASVQTVAAEARRETIMTNPDVVKGIEQVSTLDSHTTDICIAYSGKRWDLDHKPLGHNLPYNGGVPRHWNCRSVEIPVVKTFRELGIDMDEVPPPIRASTGGPVRGTMTMHQWLKSRTREQLDEQLGKGRAELFRSGKITLSQLLDLRGNPLTLAQLQRRAR